MSKVTAGEILYRITGDDAELKQALASAQKELKGTSKAAKLTSSTITRVLSGGALVLLSKKLTGLSADAAELGSKFDVVFNGISDDVNAWIGEYAEAVNRGELATKEYLASLQDIRTGFGATIPEAARFSEAVVGITNDLSSFSNVSFEETSAAIQSGLSGQFEALRRLGVGLNVAIIDQGAYAKSINKTWKEMSNLEKQEAVLSGIVSQSGNALRQQIDDWRDYNYELGDAAVTSQSFANKVKGLGQQAKDVGASVGNNLIPHMEVLVDVGSSVLEFVDELPAGVQEIGIAVAGVTAAFLAGGPIFGAISALGALAFGIIDARDRTDELADAIDNLRRVSREYHEVQETLSGDLSKLSEIEREQLRLKKERLAIETEQALMTYSIENQKFQNQQKREAKKTEALEAERKALNDVIKDYSAANEEYLKLNEAQMRATAYGKNLTEAEHSRWLALMGATEAYRHKKDGVRKAELRLEEVDKELQEDRLAALALEEQRLEAVTVAARLYKEGLIDISVYRATDLELYNEIVAAAEKLKDVEKDTGGGAAAAKEGAKSWQEWLQATLEVSAEASKSGKGAAQAYLEGFSKELETEKEIYLALNGSLEGWKPGKIIASHATAIRGAIAELLNIPAEEISNSLEGFDTSDEVIAELLRKLAELEAQLGATADASGKQGEKSKRTWQEWLQAVLGVSEEVSNSGAASAQAYLDSFRDEVERDKKVYKALNGSLEGWDPTPILESSKNKIQGAISGLLSIPPEEIANSLEGFEISDNVLQGLIAGLKEINAELDKTNEKASKESVKDWADAALSALNQFVGQATSMLNGLAKSRIQALKAQSDAELKALGLLEDAEKNRYTSRRRDVAKELRELQADARKETDLAKKSELEKAAAEKAVEMDKLAQEEANEKRRLEIKERYERQAAEIEYQAALQSWSLGFASIVASGAQAVMNALASAPGPLGIAMASVAGVMTAMQLATHALAKPQPPSFAVGAWEIPEDMTANIHAGEMILPRTFAESVRSGEASIGKSNVVVQIYTSEQVETEENQNGDLRQIKVFIGKTWIDEYRKGTFDSALLLIIT